MDNLLDYKIDMGFFRDEEIEIRSSKNSNPFTGLFTYVKTNIFSTNSGSDDVVNYDQPIPIKFTSNDSSSRENRTYSISSRSHVPSTEYTYSDDDKIEVLIRNCFNVDLPHRSPTITNNCDSNNCNCREHVVRDFDHVISACRDSITDIEENPYLNKKDFKQKIEQIFLNKTDIQRIPYQNNHIGKPIPVVLQDNIKDISYYQESPPMNLEHPKPQHTGNYNRQPKKQPRQDFMPSGKRRNLSISLPKVNSNDRLFEDLVGKQNDLNNNITYNVDPMALSTNTPSQSVSMKTPIISPLIMNKPVPEIPAPITTAMVSAVPAVPTVPIVAPVVAAAVETCKEESTDAKPVEPIPTVPVITFAPLSLDDIRKNLDVLKYVKSGQKLWLQNQCELTIDQTYFPLSGFTRWREGQGRGLICNFLKHLLAEVKRHSNQIIVDIVNKKDINANVNNLENIIKSFVLGRQGITNIKETYSSDSSIKSDFNTLEEDFDNFFRTFISTMVVQ
jgi:hypothetical protein